MQRRRSGGEVSCDLLIAAAQLRADLDEATRPVVLDVRWTLGDPEGHRHYLAGHIPGAVYVDLEAELASPASAAAGRHPLPPLASLEASARRWGIREGSAVVVYDDNGNISAARAWWLLRWGGLRDVRMLDGGLAAWRSAGLPIETGEQVAAPGDVGLSAGHMPVLDIDDAARIASEGLLLDARAGERYRGETEPIDARAGHIPGAVSAPTFENLDATGAFLQADELADRFRALGAAHVGAVGVYCGSGISAAHEIAALRIAGFDAALYPGSWSQWSADPTRPAAP
jgi:thiosulfate/3-mercaptopyruvate sulfurtransferase